MAFSSRLQSFGRTLSAMVMPNIGAFIAWGLITALFIPNGWLPNEHLAKIGEPMMKYLLPLLIAWTAGSNVSGVRGGVCGAIATLGVIAGSNVPMFIGAMIMGPLAGWCVKEFDAKVGSKVKAGFEMLVNNFSLGIIGMLLSILGFLVIGNVVEWLTGILKLAVEALISHKLLPLAALFVEPGKVMFLNNAINHGICDVIGVQQVQELGKSIIFLIETNPGPGLGVLLAIWAFGKGAAKDSAPGAVIIHFLGGIHEIYFPYILAQPLLIASTILGSASALLFYSLTGAGLVAPASPGSIIAILAMAPKGQTLLVAAGVILAALVSFIVSVPIIKLSSSKVSADNAAVSGLSESAEAAEVKDDGSLRKIVFACDAGMGSSALGATRFKSRLMKIGRSDIVCTNSAIDSLPEDAGLVICQRALGDRTAKVVASRSFAGGKPEILCIGDFLSDPQLDDLLNSIEKGPDASETADPAIFTKPASASDILLLENIRVGLGGESKEEAIARAGSLLVSGGYVEAEYVPAMLEREKETTTYMGMGIAIPHGTSEAKKSVRRSGIVVLQYPEGVEFGDEKAHLVIGLAGAGDEHLEILAKISSALDDETVLQKLFTTTSPQDIYDTLK